MPTTAEITKVRLRFAKRGDLRLVSHHDLMRCLERMLRRANLPIAQSQGFNPRPKLVFALAMALGIEGLREVLELELTEPIAADEVARRLAAVAPSGFDIQEAESVRRGPAARPLSVSYRTSGPVPADRIGPARVAIEKFLALESVPYTRQRPDRTVEVDLRPYVIEAEIGPDGPFRFRLRIDPGGSARPEEVLEAVGLRDLLEAGFHLVRDEVELADQPEPGGPNSPPRHPTVAPSHPLEPTDPRDRAAGPPDREYASHEERDVDQCPPAGGMSDRDRRGRPA